MCYLGACWRQTIGACWRQKLEENFNGFQSRLKDRSLSLFKDNGRLAADSIF